VECFHSQLWHQPHIICMPCVVTCNKQSNHNSCPIYPRRPLSNDEPLFPTPQPTHFHPKQALPCNSNQSEVLENQVSLSEFSVACKQIAHFARHLHPEREPRGSCSILGHNLTVPEKTHRDRLLEITSGVLRVRTAISRGNSNVTLRRVRVALRNESPRIFPVKSGEPEVPRKIPRL
jgi:hypothetical protein